MAAEGYARMTGKPAVVNVTTGPGGINTLNGVYGAFTNSIPMLVISGQVKRETYIRTYDLPGLRQLGDQEVDTSQWQRELPNTRSPSPTHRPSVTILKRLGTLHKLNARPVLARHPY